MRMRFVARLKEGEKMAVLCRESDISRKTGYKLYNRYQNCGIEGFDRSRHRVRTPIACPSDQERSCNSSRSTRAGELREIRDRSSCCKTIQLPLSPMRCWIDGLVGSGRRNATRPKALSPTRPNDLWCADYRAEFMPPINILLSVDHHRLLQATCCAATPRHHQEMYAFTVFERGF